MKILAINTYGDFDCLVQTLFKGGELSPQPSVVLAELKTYMEEPVVDDEGFQTNCRSYREQQELKELFYSILDGHGYKEYKPNSITIGD